MLAMIFLKQTHYRSMLTGVIPRTKWYSSMRMYAPAVSIL